MTALNFPFNFLFFPFPISPIPFFLLLLFHLISAICRCTFLDLPGCSHQRMNSFHSRITYSNISTLSNDLLFKASPADQDELANQILRQAIEGLELSVVGLKEQRVQLKLQLEDQEERLQWEKDKEQAMRRKY